MDKTKLSLPRIEPTKEAPFKDDKIGRKPLAERITRVLEASEDAVVLAVDGGWGTGKSTFARMLQAHLDGRGFHTTYIDAFAVDYVEDPFVPIFARLQALIEREKDVLDKSQDVIKKAARVMGVLLAKAGSAAVTMAVQAGMLGLTGVPLLGAEKVGDKAAEAWEELAARRISNFLKEELYIEEYKQALAVTAQAYYAKHDKPLVIMIDELDRCRPDFAVLFLERIKHFFEVPHITFVLIIHRDQLEKSIRGCYGAEIDARTYLQKFITHNFEIDPLEPVRLANYGSESSHKREDLIRDILVDAGWAEDEGAPSLSRLINEFQLSIRELGKLKIQIIFSGVGRSLNHRSMEELEAWLILSILKIKNTNFYGEIVRGKNVRTIWDKRAKIIELLKLEIPFSASSIGRIIRLFSPSVPNKLEDDSFWDWVYETLEA